MEGRRLACPHVYTGCVLCDAHFTVWDKEGREGARGSRQGRAVEGGGELTLPSVLRWLDSIYAGEGGSDAARGRRRDQRDGVA